MLINQVVDYLNLLRLKEDELMQLSRITKMNCVAKHLQKQTKTCMMAKIWSKLLNQKASHQPSGQYALNDEYLLA